MNWSELNLLTDACRLWDIAFVLFLFFSQDLNRICWDLNTPNQKTDKKADFTEVRTLADDEVIRCLLISSTLNRSISVYLVFSYDYAKSCQNCLFSYDSIWKLLPNQLLIIIKWITFKGLFPFNMLDSTETVQFTAAAYLTWLHYWNITYYFKHEDTEKN